MTSSRMFFPVNPVAPKMVTSYVLCAMVDLFDEWLIERVLVELVGGVEKEGYE